MPNTDEFAGAMIADVARLLRTAFDRRVRKLGLTRAQWLGLTRLYRRPGASQSEFADMMEIEKATAGRLVDRLEAKGWVERRAQNGDRRVKRIYLTREAERVHKRIWRIAEATVDDALADLLQRDEKPSDDRTDRGRDPRFCPSVCSQALWLQQAVAGERRGL